MKNIVMVFGAMAMMLLPFFYIQAEESVWQVTEVMANAADEDTGEFVELRYTGKGEQFLSGWTVGDGKEMDNLIDYTGKFNAGKNGLVVDEGDVLLIVDSGYAGQYNDVLESAEVDLSRVVMVTVADAEIGNGLANAGDEVVLKNQAGEVIAAFVWSGDAGNGVSWEQVGSDWIKCGLEGGNSFGYVRNEEGSSSNDQGSSESQDNENDQDSSESQNENNWTRFWEGGEDPAKINELMINPVGDDETGEWIELRSYWEEDVDLKGWWVCDSKCNADSKTGGYEIGDVILESGGYVVLERSVTKIALNNDVDSVWLYDPEHNLVASVVYDLKIQEGESFAWNDGIEEWNLTTIVTKDAENEFEEEIEKVSSNKEQVASEAENEKGSSSNDQGLSEEQNEEYEEIDNIKLVKEKADGVKVSFEGVVTAEWNLLENEYLWVGDNTGGISAKFDTDPGFRVGEKVWIGGEVHELTYRKVILVSDYKKIGEGEVPVSVLSKDDQLVDFEDMVVKLAGEVVETSGDDFYLNLGGDSDIRVYIKENTGIIKPEMKKGDSFEVMGIVNEIKSGFRVLPRYQEDAVKSGQVTTLPKVGFDWSFLFN